MKATCGFCERSLGPPVVTRGDGRHVMRCPQGCGWWVLDPPETQYDETYFGTGEDGIGYGEGYSTSIDPAAVRWCERNLNRQSKWLEIGCGNGQLALRLSSLKVDVIATDVSRAFLSTLAGTGLRFVEADAVAALSTFPERSVLLVDSFEHLPDPAQFLTYWARTSSQELVMRSPNGHQIDFLRTRSNLLHRSYEHAWYPRLTCLGEVLALDRMRVDVSYEALRYVKLPDVRSGIIGRRLANNVWVSIKK